MLKKILHQTHLWMGLLSSLIVFILGITGCILAFVDEIKPVVYKNHYYVESTSPDHERQSFSTLLDHAEQHWGAEKQVSAVEIENNPQRTWHFRAYKEDDNDGIWYWNEKKYYESVFINPYTAANVYSENAEFEFFRVILYLHWSLLFKNDIGQPIVGTATLFFVLLLLTGLYLWWPKNKKARRVRFWFRWKNKTGIKRKNYDLHNILGFYSFTIALILGLTGMIWAFPWFDESVQQVLNKIENKAPETVLAKPIQSKAHFNTNLSVYDNILNEVEVTYPDAHAYYFYFPQKEEASLNVYIRYEKSYASIIRQYEVKKGYLQKTIDFSSKNYGEKMRALNYDIHLGSILGIPGKMLVFLASLIAASLPVTGFYIWYNRRKKKKKKA
ncbi:PepSY domain-containing protein [Sphingobacterium kitahiroshimense]|uniref:PepSY-associated TM helix domain-containing protein n=1 Tax=Sphingobacterium sp. B16(2022) TaxID=2914044 RepID=UPI00181CCDD8|nr:PepSY-associated TM helix domain-containing protein [Sphingobacterium sp. B16(2022)]NJI72374.1 PepSY domain-containing protein [Sphingobacterium sp. B16(2022)]